MHSRNFKVTEEWQCMQDIECLDTGVLMFRRLTVYTLFPSDGGLWCHDETGMRHYLSVGYLSAYFTRAS